MTEGRALRTEERALVRELASKGITLWFPPPRPWPVIVRRQSNREVIFYPERQMVSVPLTISSPVRLKVAEGFLAWEEGDIYRLNLGLHSREPAHCQPSEHLTGAVRSRARFSLDLLPSKPWNGYLHFVGDRPIPRCRTGDRLAAEVWLEDDAGLCYGAQLSLFDLSDAKTVEERQELYRLQEACRLD